MFLRITQTLFLKTLKHFCPELVLPQSFLTGYFLFKNFESLSSATLKPTKYSTLVAKGYSANTYFSLNLFMTYN